jgi:hypothetical protein
LAPPKENGGWGLKILFLFSKTLVAKNVWRLVQGQGLWAQVMKSKYLSPYIFQEYIRNMVK